MSDCNHIPSSFSSIAFSCFGDMSVFPAVECRTTFSMGNRWQAQLIVFLLTVNLSSFFLVSHLFSYVVFFSLLLFSLSFPLSLSSLSASVSLSFAHVCRATLLWENKHGCLSVAFRQTPVASLLGLSNPQKAMKGRRRDSYHAFCSHHTHITIPEDLMRDSSLWLMALFFW